jgi:predicted aspartyl protease
MPTVFSAQSAKAVTAALVAGLSALAVVVTDDGSASLATLTLAQWLAIATAVVGAFVATYNVPNASATIRSAPLADQPVPPPHDAPRDMNA